MDLEHITSFLFAVHIALLIVKIWSTFVIFGWFTTAKSSNNKSFMLVYELSYLALFVFSVIMLAMEIHFLYAFFISASVDDDETSKVSYKLLLIVYLKNYNYT